VVKAAQRRIFWRTRAPRLRTRRSSGGGLGPPTDAPDPLAEISHGASLRRYSPHGGLPRARCTWPAIKQQSAARLARRAKMPGGADRVADEDAGNTTFAEGRPARELSSPHRASTFTFVIGAGHSSMLLEALKEDTLPSSKWPQAGNISQQIRKAQSRFGSDFGTRAQARARRPDGFQRFSPSVSCKTVSSSSQRQIGASSN